MLVSTTNLALANVLLQGFYWDVPSKPAGTSNVAYYDHLARQANAIRKAGFTAVWLPPVLKSAAGGYSVGYDPFDDYDLGSKFQRGTLPTRYGTRDQLQRMCAMMRSNGLELYADLVQNHRNGDPGDYQFSYLNAFGVNGLGRFGKSYYDFHPNVPQDPNVPETPEIGFGRDLAHVNGPGGWIGNQLIAAGDWKTKALDLQGYRLDFVKGISTDWLGQFLNSQSMSGKFAVGEFYDYDLWKVQNWIASLGRRSSAFDFPLRGLLKQMCDYPTSFQMSWLDHAGLAGVDPLKAVTFVENHDTDKEPSDKIYNNKLLAYAYILTSEGYPTVFYRDWSRDPGCYGNGLQERINNLIWIHEKLASGTTQERWKNDKVFVYERQGGSKLLVGLNNNVDPGNITTGWNYVITCQTGFGPNVQLRDYTGHRPDVWTDANGQVTLDLPPAIGGRGYVAYAPVNAATGGFSAPLASTTQEYAGAADLDIRPATAAPVVVAKPYVMQGSRPTVSLYWNGTNFTSVSELIVEVRDPNQLVVATWSYKRTTVQGQPQFWTASKSGHYTITIRSKNAPPSNSAPNYWMKVNYRTPQSFPVGTIPAIP